MEKKVKSVGKSAISPGIESKTAAVVGHDLESEQHASSYTDKQLIQDMMALVWVLTL